MIAAISSTPRKRDFFSLCLFFLAGQLLIQTAVCRELTVIEAAGKRIYTQGIDQQGRAFDALVGEADIPLPSTALPCSGCHGENAEGGEEGGVKPPPLTWTFLTKHYGHIHSNKRRHPAFTEESFAATLREGVDPANNRLDATMPRFRLSDENIKALVSYLKLITTETEEGITDSTIRVGTLVPMSGQLGMLGDVMLSALRFMIKRQNMQGGLYGRRIELIAESYDENRELTLSNLERLLDEHDVFALLSPFIVGIENEAAALSAGYKIPVIAPFSQINGSPNYNLEYLFYLRSSFREQAKALLKYYSEISDSTGNGILFIRNTGVLDSVAAALHEESEVRDLRLREVSINQARQSWDDLISSGRENNEQMVFFYGSGTDLLHFLQRADQMDWHPLVSLPEALVGFDLFSLPKSFSNRVYLTHPDPVGEKRYRSTDMIEAFFNSNFSSQSNLEIQLAALNAVAVFNECLKRTGRKISRARFIEAIESLKEWDSTIGPAISFGSNRRVATQGTRIICVDIANHNYRLISEWFALN